MSELERPSGEAVAAELSYGEWLEQIKQRVSAAQRRAAQAVNAELLGVYREIGREILHRQQAEGNRRGRGGPRIIERLSADLTVAFPGIRSFRVGNLRYMRKFAAAWPQREMLQHGAEALPWGHIMVLLDRLDSREQRDWYAARAASEGWTRATLEFQITTDLRSREGAVLSNFERTLDAAEAVPSSVR